MNVYSQPLEILNQLLAWFVATRHNQFRGELAPRDFEFAVEINCASQCKVFLHIVYMSMKVNQQIFAGGSLWPEEGAQFVQERQVYFVLTPVWLCLEVPVTISQTMMSLERKAARHILLLKAYTCHSAMLRPKNCHNQSFRLVCVFSAAAYL